MFDNAYYFNSIDITQYSLEKGIQVRYFSNYYPQGNVLVESSNKNLINILKNTVADNHTDWHVKIFNALWEDMITPKVAIGNYPLCLVYGN